MEQKINPRLQRMNFGSVARQSGANPDFKVTSATRNERELKLMLTRLNKRSDLLERKLAARERIISDAPKSPEVVEPFDDVEKTAIEPKAETPSGETK